MDEITSLNPTTHANLRPLIGVVLDWQASGSFSPRPHYAVRESYFHAIYAAGGLPVALPLIEEALPELLARVQGVVIPGGDYPSPSRWYGEDRGIPDEHPRSLLNEELVRMVLNSKKPLLGICAGMQEMVAATGGLLYWRVAQCLPEAINHRGVQPNQTCHEVKVAEGSLLNKLTGQSTYAVNSHHSEGVKSLSGGLVATAHAPDGLIEAVEMPDHPFAIGVQWHPEFLLSDADKALFTGLIEAARKS